MPRVKLIQIRGGTASAWTTANPVLALREMGVETDTRKHKFGDGVTAWSSLAYAATGGGGGGTWGSITGTLSDQTDLQTALDAISTEIDDHIADDTAAHAASAISNTAAGNISATTVQAAINELDADKQAALGFTAENVANKATDFTTLNNTLYPTTQAVSDKINASIEGLQNKADSRVATTANITLSGIQTIDGVLLIAGDRVLVKDQSAASENGIYVSAVGAWSRSGDTNTGVELRGAVTSIDEGTLNADTTWRQTADNITVGSTSITWVQYGASVPDATSTTKGKARLYPSTSLGANTDGAPDQNAVKVYVDAKVADAITDGVTTIAPSQNAVFDALALKAPLNSPAITGTPTAPTAAPGTNTTQIATTAYVRQSNIGSLLYLYNNFI